VVQTLAGVEGIKQLDRAMALVDEICSYQVFNVILLNWVAYHQNYQVQYLIG
jgi:hypothetical protein